MKLAFEDPTCRNYFGAIKAVFRMGLLIKWSSLVVAVAFAPCRVFNDRIKSSFQVVQRRTFQPENDEKPDCQSHLQIMFQAAT